MTDDLAGSHLIARVLELEFGSAPHLQIGLFESPQAGSDALPEAQQKFCRLLQGEILQSNAPPTAVLLAGEALAQLALDIASQGVQTHWLSNRWQDRLAVANTPISHLKVEQHSLLEIRPTAESKSGFDSIVIAGSYRYLDQLTILSRCRQLMRVDGRLLVFGEYLRDDSSIEHSSLANLSSLQQLSERLGFERIAESDLTSNAAHSARVFIELLKKHRDTLCVELNVPDSLLAIHLQHFSSMLYELENGRRCFQLRQYRLPEPLHNEKLGEYASAEYGDIDSFDRVEIKTLFEQSFGKSFNQDLWQWKYESGNGKSVVARVEPRGEIVAHYGGAPRQIQYFGKPAMAIQVCDVMVLPEKRRQYGKNSLFFKVAATFLEREIGNTVNHLLGFGFPNQKAMNIATRLGLYEKTDDFIEIDYGPVPESSSKLEQTELIIDDSEHRQQLDVLWQKMAAGLQAGIIGNRDWSYLKYRYFDHPFAASNQYRCLFLRASADDEPIALAVLKQHAERPLLMDLVCPMDRVQDVISSLNQLLNEQSRGQGLRLWLTRGWLERVHLDGCVVNELGIEIPCNSWNPGPNAEDLYGKWWLTAGDMDFM